MFVYVMISEDGSVEVFKDVASLSDHIACLAEDIPTRFTVERCDVVEFIQ